MNQEPHSSPLAVSQTWKLLLLLTKWYIFKRLCLAVLTSEPVFFCEAENPYDGLICRDLGHQCSGNCVQFPWWSYLNGSCYEDWFLGLSRSLAYHLVTIHLLRWLASLLVLKTYAMHYLTELYGETDMSQSNLGIFSILNSKWWLLDLISYPVNPPFYRQQHWGTVEGSDLPKATQLDEGRAGNGNQVFFVPLGHNMIFKVVDCSLSLFLFGWS